MTQGPEFVVGLDLGGSGVRCVLADLDGGARVRTARAWASMPAPGGGADLDLDLVWRKVGESVREALQAGGVAPDRVAGLAVAGMRFATVALDARGEVLLAAPNHDARGAGPGLQLAAEHGEVIEAATGHWPSPIGTAARWAALPAEVRARVATVFGLHDWLAWRLCAERATDPTQAAGTLVYDLATGAWSDELCERVGLPRAVLPEVRACGSALGTLRADAAEAVGLRAGTPVATGGGDTQLGLFGLGALAPGSAAAICGTTLPVQVVHAGAAPRRPRLWVEPLGAGGHHVVESNAGPVGDALAWLARLLRPDAAEPAAWLLAQAGAGAPNAAGLFSNFGGQVMDARALGLPVGELSLTHLTRAEPAELARAVVEGMAFTLRANLEQAAGEGPDALFLGGRMARSPSWARLVAGACGRPVEVGREPEATGLGAALCAAVGAGRFADLSAAAAALVTTVRVEPDAAECEVLEGRYTTWCQWREARAPAAAVTQGVALQGLLGAAGGAARAADPAPPLRILVTAQMDEAALDALRELGEVEYASYRDARRLLSGAALVDALQGVDVFVTEIDLVDAASMLALPDLRVVASCRGDAVNVDVEAASELGIPVLNAPGRNADAVADLTLGFLLALARKLPEANAFLRQPGMQAGDMGAMGQAYGALRGQELGGRTVGLVGFGAVGRKVAARLLPFGARVLVHDPFQEDEALRRAGVEPCPLDRLLAGADFVSLHAAVTEASTGLIDADAIAAMKPGAGLVNTARAALVDEAALCEALARGHLGGAALDVFSEEPPGAEHPLLAFPNVLATPHVGGNTEQIGSHQGRIVSEDLARLVRGEALRCALDPEVADAFSWSVPRPVPSESARARLEERPPPAVTDLQKSKKQEPRPQAPSAAKAEGPGPAVDPAARATFEARVARFVARFADDAAVCAAAGGESVTLHFVLEDLGLDFHLGLHEGVATGALGDPGGEPEVVLRLESAVLDRMFGGESRAMDEAMAGNLAFQGDAAKAMTLQTLEADLIRLYTAARG